jgi:hypothetical protein
MAMKTRFSLALRTMVAVAGRTAVGEDSVSRFMEGAMTANSKVAYKPKLSRLFVASIVDPRIMTKKLTILTFLLAACLAQAFAASDIVYVSTTGLDTHPCTRAAMCKTITHALTVVNKGGEVAIVGSGTYDNFTITKAVTIAAEPGVLASFDVPANTNGITIAAGGSDIVTLRGLNLGGQGSGNGIQVNSAGQVNVEDCVSRNFSGALTFTPSSAATLRVKGGVFDSPNNVAIFVCCFIGGKATNVSIDGAKIYNGTFAGINSDAAVATITNSTLTGLDGVNGDGIHVAHGSAVVANNVISNYGAGIGNFDTSYLSSNTITGNSVGISVSGGTAFTRGDNTVEANTTNVSGALTPFSPK